MADKGYLKERRENAIARLLDASIDFDVLFKDKKKILGVFSIGNFLERNDRKIFKFLLATLDDHVVGKSPNQKVVDEIERLLSLLEANDISGFVDYIAGIVADEIKTPFEGFEKQIYIGVLSTFNGLIGKAIEKAIVLNEKADTEDNTNE